jgi:phosphoglycerol transferase MdoB-like AlkP superfamily enzyme
MSGADTNAATGVGMLAVLAYTIYWVVRSRKRWRTILYSLLSAAAVFLVACLAAWMLPAYAGAMGTLASFFLFIAMAITAAEHARFTIRHSTVAKAEMLRPG